MLLAQLTSKQLMQWMAFATLEPVGEPVPQDREELAKQKAAEQRAKVEGGLMALKNRGNHGHR